MSTHVTVRTGRSERETFEARPRRRDKYEVASEVLAWQDRLRTGADPGPTPIGTTGGQLTREAAVRYFGDPDPALAAAARTCPIRARR
jgi:hypothetical protein